MDEIHEVNVKSVAIIGAGAAGRIVTLDIASPRLTLDSRSNHSGGFQG
jgi:hypothetical protein